MKRLVGNFLIAAAMVSVCGLSGAFAAKPGDAKTKAANAAHSNEPSAVPMGAAPGTAGGSTNATGEAMQATMSPAMTKAIVDMKACHKNGKDDMKCHDRVMKSCEAKLTKEECARVMSEVNSDNAKKHM